MIKQKLFYLDFIRFFSCLIILVFHFSRITNGYQIYGFYKLDLFANGDWGFIAVAIFFLLSGFSFMYNYENKNLDVKRFYVKRFNSIYPFYWISYFFICIYYLIVTGTVANYEAIKTNPIKLLIGGVLTFIGLDGYLSYTFYLIGEWFLPCIILIYVFFPLIKRCMDKNDKLFFLIVSIGYLLVLFLEKYSPILIHRNILVCGFQFILGMYLYKYKLFICNKIQLIISIIIVIILLSIKVNVHSSIIVTIIAFLIFTILRECVVQIKKFPFKKVIQYISKKSFLIFLLHHVVMNEVLKYFENITINFIEATILLFICFIIIILLCEFMELIYSLIFRKKLKKCSKK